VKPVLSVIVPTLNAAQVLPATLSSLTELPESEIIVVDGGSSDSTVRIASEYGATVLSAKSGRGTQLAAGADAAKCEWFLFLHADTVLEPGWPQRVQEFIRTANSTMSAAYFRFALDHDSPQAQRLEKIVAWRCRRFGLPYGDQGLLIHRDLYRSAGGYSPVPLMEDVDFIRRLRRKTGRQGLQCLPARAVTGSERYRRDGYLLRSSRNLLCLTAYWLGVPTQFIARLYG